MTTALSVVGPVLSCVRSGTAACDAAPWRNPARFLGAPAHALFCLFAISKERTLFLC